MDVEVQGSDGPPLVMPLAIPATLSLDVLQSILAGCGTSVSLEQLQAPSSHLVIQIYTALLTIPTLRDTISQFEVERKESERRGVDVEMQLHEAERLKDEAEKRAEESRKSKEESIGEKNEVSSQLAEAKGKLEGMQSNMESGTQQSAEVKGQLEKIQQEKRDLLELLEREKVESARRAVEVDTLTIRSRDARNEASRLATELAEAKSAEGTAMFKIQRLEQELALKSNDTAWAHQELRKTTEELAQSRNQSHNEIASLTSQIQQVTQALEASQRKASSLQAAYDDAVARLEEGTREKSELRQKLVEQEGAFASEMSTQQRLGDLMRQEKENAEGRVAAVEEQWEAILDEHREREDGLRSEIAEGKRAREAVEREKDEIQLALDQLAEGVGIETNGNGRLGDPDISTVTNGSIPSFTSNRSFISLSGTPSLMSPTAALTSKVQRSGKSFTQVYAELARTQEELRRERLESSRIGGVLEQVIADLQERGPALVAQREECEQMSQDLQEMSATLAKACEERDWSEREAKTKRLESEASLRENRILNQQVSDLGRQVRDLTREILLRDDPTAARRLEDDGSNVEAADQDPLSPVSDTQAVISAQLVTFQSLTELVTQNGRLLRVVRELGTKMEAEEEKYRARLEDGENEAVAEAKELISRLQEEVRAERARMEAVRRERDMFRSMCASGNVRGQGETQSAAAEESSSAYLTLTSQYNQLKSQLEAFRLEAAKDTERLQEEANEAKAEASRNALSATKESASRESVEERLTNAQQTHQLAKKELEEMQRRFTSLQESLTRQEVASHSLSQQLLIAHGNEERLRNEVSNLAAEKNLHQQTSERLMEEKKSISAETTNLSELLRNAQSVQAELERSSEEVKRRLEAQMETLEEQGKDLKSRVSREEESHRQTLVRKDAEASELQNRLDKANETLSKTSEELAVAKNSVEHLTAKSEELQKQVDSKEAKLAVYERRNLGSDPGATGEASSSVDREQQLQIELVDLKGELRSAQVDAEQARAHVEQFKAIATANEEALSQLQAAYDEYKTVMDASVAAKTTESDGLRERVEAITTELALAQKEVGGKEEGEQQSTAWEAEKKTLEEKSQTLEKREQQHFKKAKEFNTLMKAAIKERDELKEQMSQNEQERASEIEKVVQERMASGGEGGIANESALEELRQRIVELEDELEKANARIKELAGDEATPKVDELQQKHDIALKELESRLTLHFSQRQKSAVEIATSKAKAAAEAGAGTKVEEQVQTRLKMFEDQREESVKAAIEAKERELKAAYEGQGEEKVKAAIEAKEKELKGAYEDQLKARYEAGKEEASLRNRLMLKAKDNRIEKLSNELNALKGSSEGVPAPPPAGPSSSSSATPSGPAVAQGQRPVLPTRPVGRPASSPTTVVPQTPAARGGSAARGGGVARGGGRPPAAGNVQKRKLEGGQQAGGEGAAGAAANGAATEGGGLPKRPRPAGGPITIRGGAGGNRGGRGGHAA